MSDNSGNEEVVPYFDAETERIIHKPRHELPDEIIQVQIEGIDGPVWMSMEYITPSPIKHGPFSEEIRTYIRRIQNAFEEFRGLTFEEWEDGFRRDANPEREIAIWIYAAEIYSQYAANEALPSRRKDIYGCVIAGIMGDPGIEQNVLKKLEALDREEGERIINQFKGNK